MEEAWLLFLVFLGLEDPLSAFVIHCPQEGREERGKPYSFAQGQLSNCLILWNKGFELRKLNLAVGVEPAEVLHIQVALLFPSFVVLIPSMKLNPAFPMVRGKRKEQWDFPGKSRK